jgi:hypothetical protein
MSTLGAPANGPLDSVRALLSDAVDYAGLFPPASLPLAECVRLYDGYLRGPHAWALGRFVVPAARLAELDELRAGKLPKLPPEPPWPLSVLVGDDVEADHRRIVEFAARSTRGRVASIEAKATDAADVEAIAGAMRGTAERLGTPLYVELPLTGASGGMVGAIRQARLRAKGRSGGVRADAIPPAAALVDFLLACVGTGVAFKVTAGLHHALRGSHPLTYEADSASAVMHGFLNVFVAAALLAAQTDGVALTDVLEETDASAFRFDGGAVAWRDRRADLAAIHQARELLVSFGSCSFEEPIEALARLGLA